MASGHSPWTVSIISGGLPTFNHFYLTVLKTLNFFFFFPRTSRGACIWTLSTPIIFLFQFCGWFKGSMFRIMIWFFKSQSINKIFFFFVWEFLFTYITVIFIMMFAIKKGYLRLAASYDYHRCRFTWIPIFNSIGVIVHSISKKCGISDIVEKKKNQPVFKQSNTRTAGIQIIKCKAIFFWCYMIFVALSIFLLWDISIILAVITVYNILFLYI